MQERSPSTQAPHFVTNCIGTMRPRRLAKLTVCTEKSPHPLGLACSAVTSENRHFHSFQNYVSVTGTYRS